MMDIAKPQMQALEQYALLADENIQPDVVTALRFLGINVWDVKEEHFEGSSDMFLLAEATAQGRFILTHDSDFGTLAVAQEQVFIGIVYLRPGYIQPEQIVETINAIFTQNISPSPPFIIVAERKADHVKIRIRSLSPL